MGQEAGQPSQGGEGTYVFFFCLFFLSDLSASDPRIREGFNKNLKNPIGKKNTAFFHGLF